jgi:hypothetical protein
MMSHAPWQTQQRGTKMTQLKKLDLLVGGIAILFLLFVTAVLFSNRSPNDQTTAALPRPTAVPTTADSLATVPLATASIDDPTPIPTPPAEGRLALSIALPDADQQNPALTGMAYEETNSNGRLFIANGRQGIQRYSKTGEDLGPLVILDPDTGQPVFVRDVVWSRLLWLAPPEYGLVALTDPFQNGAYLHALNPDDGAIIGSYEINSNIAIPSSATFISVTVPSQLVATDNGELYADRTYYFAPETADQPPASFHYLLRLVLDGRILNPMLVAQSPTDTPADNIIAALAYQTSTDSLYAAVRQGTSGIVQKYDLIGAPRKVATLDQELINWQENIAFTTDSRGHLFILLDNPQRIVELDQDDQIVNTYGFRDLADASADYPVTYWFPGSIGQPLALAHDAQ